MILEEYENWDAVRIAELIRNGELSPRLVASAAIERIERWNPQLNAVIHRTYERGLQQAERSPNGTPLSGVPFLLKDLGQSWAGVPTRAGSRATEGFLPSLTTTLTQRYLDAGLVILGKTNTPEMGMAPVTEPELFDVTRNPWNLDTTAGGSSGGAAAAVAAGMVPVAHGSDGGGSIRIPASNCGLFGLKPTRARTPHGPVMAESWYGLSVNHVLSRTVRDSALLLDLTQGPEPGDAYAAPPPPESYLAEVTTPTGPLQIGVINGSILGDSIQWECQAAVDETRKLLESLGHQISELTLPINAAVLSEALVVLAAADMANGLNQLDQLMGRKKPDPKLYELQTWTLSLVGHKLSAAQVSAAMFEVRTAGRILGRIMENYDLLLSSTLSRTPWAHGQLQPTELERMVMRGLRRFPLTSVIHRIVHRLSRRLTEPIPNTPLFNVTGQPAMSVPLHWTADHLPVGVQFVGRFGDETTLFRLAGQLEDSRPWFDRRPPLVVGSEAKVNAAKFASPSQIPASAGVT